MILKDPDEEIATEYFDFTNDLVGVFAISLSATAIQYKHPEPFAWFFLIVVVFWAFSKKEKYRKITDLYIKRYNTPIGVTVVCWRVKIFITGVACLIGV